jgi:phosphoribosylformylglycinamidine synthase
MAAKGAKAVAATDCLNFGNPEKPEIMSEFVASVDALTEAALVFQTPVVSGNVSFYNETLGKNIISTPATGLIGLREDAEEIPFDHFQQDGNPVYRVSAVSNDLIQLKKFQEILIDMGQSSSAVASRVIGRGGLAVALGKMCVGSTFGFELERDFSQQELGTEYFYQVLFEVDLQRQDEFLRKMKGLQNSVYGAEKIGRVIKNRFDLGKHGSCKVDDIKARYEKGFLNQL